MATVFKLKKLYEVKGGEIYSNVGGTGFANGDQSTAVELGHTQSVKAWQVTGTFGTGGSIQLEASLEGATWVIVGTALTSAGYVAANIPCRFLRFNVTAGDGTTSLFVTLFALPQRGS